MTTAWLDTTAGVAGDMILAALVDAGAPLAEVQRAIDQVIPGSVALRAEIVERQGQRATKVEVDVLVDDPPHRTWASIRRMLTDAALDPRTRDLALAAFSRLADAEGHVHGIDPEDVHFHEVGALDSIADVVGACEALRLLGIDEVSGTPVAVGEGRVRVAHGLMPVPVPAVAQLALGWPTISGALPPAPHSHGHSHGDEGEHHQHHSHGDHHDHPEPRPVGELATPTGMALVRTFARTWGSQPDLVTTAIGIGAGTKDTPGRPNVVRVLIGRPDAAGTPTTVAELQANVDDLDPRLWPGVLDRVLAAGAVDAWLVPILMKRGRPAHTLHVLCRPTDADAISDVIFATTTTLGVRRHAALHRRTLDRRWVDLEVAGQRVRMKVASRDDTIVQATPEFADVVAAAEATGREQVDVLRAAEAAAVAAGLVAGAPVRD